MINGKCITTCTTPEHGMVEKGKIVTFEIESWNVKKYPHLKHFNQAGSGASRTQPSVEQGLDAQKAVVKPAPLGTVGGAAGPARAATGGDNTNETPEVKSFAKMTPEDIDSLSNQNIVDMVRQAYDAEMDVNASKESLINEALEIETSKADEAGNGDNTEIFD